MREYGTRTLALSVVVGLIGLVGPSSPAGAATQVGQTVVLFGTSCPNVTVLQSSSPGGQYTVPSAGVITSWSFLADAAPVTTRLKVARPAGGASFTIVGDSPPHTPTANQLNTFDDVRISVQPGNVIGLYVGPGVAPGCGSAAPLTYGVHFISGDQAPGSSAAYAPSNAQLDVSASLEPDADNDGFGDETQDACPTSAATQNECVAPQTQITKHPKDKTKKKTATFEFTANEPGSTFECSLDGGAFAACSSPDTLKVKKGKHSFAVRATDAAGNVDASPATDDWKVKKKKK